MKTESNHIQYSKLPDHVKIGVAISIGGKAVSPSANAYDEVDYDYTFTIGQMIEHTAQSNVPIISVRWVVTNGSPVSNYTITAAAGTVAPLTDVMLQSNPMRCAYTVPEAVVVGAYITTAYGTGYVRASALLTSPEVNMFEAATEQVYVGPYLHQDWIRFGDPAHPDAPGITINAVTYGAQNVPGTLGILQLATNMRVGSDEHFHTYHWSLNGQAVLDVGPGGAYVFYQNAHALLNPGENAQFDITDAPGSQLGPPFTLLSIGDGAPVVPESYQSFLMFCPNTAGSIFVPLSVLDWYWAGYSELKDAVWSPVQSPENSVNPVGAGTHMFPTWNNNTNAGAWVQGAGDNLGVRDLVQKRSAASV